MLGAGGLCYGVLRRNPMHLVRRKVHRLLRVDSDRLSQLEPQWEPQSRDRRGASEARASGREVCHE
jgi:hypothetical protein